jgi:CRP-like cAMP-binding protein
LERLLAAMVPIDAGPDTVLVRQGDVGDRYYLVSDGQVAVSVDGVEVRRLGRGDGFGEIALLRDVPRTATATAITAMRGYSVGRDDFLAALSGHGLALAHSHAQRLLDEDRSRGGERQSG